MTSAIRLQNEQWNGPSLRRWRRMSHRINSDREALGRTILRLWRGAWVEVALVRLRFRKRSMLHCRRVKGKSLRSLPPGNVPPYAKREIGGTVQMSPAPQRKGASDGSCSAFRICRGGRGDRRACCLQRLRYGKKRRDDEGGRYTTSTARRASIAQQVRLAPNVL
jgi:hypothetical protein